MILPGDKIENKYQNPIDIFLLFLCRLIDDPLHKVNITPNMITIFGLFLGLLSIHFLIKKNYILAIAFLWLTYFTDCLDGYMARKHNQITRLGDFLDHFRDQFVILCVVFIVCLHIKNFQFRLIFLTITMIVGTLSLSQLGCQERISEYQDHNDCLDKLRHLCPGNAEENIKITRWFGCGTFYLVLSIFIFLLKSKV